MKKSTTRIVAILIAVVLLIGCSIGIISASAAPNYNMATVQKIENALASFENKVKDGTVYTNMSAAYTAYVNLSRTLDMYYYGNDNSVAGSIDGLINTLNTEMGKMTVWSPVTPNNNAITDPATQKIWNGDDTPYTGTSFHYTNVVWSEYSWNPEYALKTKDRDITGANKMTTVQFATPVYALVWDGMNTPCFAAMFQVWSSGTTSADRFMYAAELRNAASDGISLKNNWYTGNTGTSNTTGTWNHCWNYWRGAYSDQDNEQLSYSGTTYTAGTTGARYRQGRNSYNKRFANDIYFTSNPFDSNNPYYKAVQPYLRTYASTKQSTWNTDIITDVSDTTAVHIFNYKALIDAVKAGFAKFANVNQYREGGLSNLITALNNAMSYDYNNAFKNIGYQAITDNGLVASVGNEIKTRVEGINNATITQDKYATLRSAINQARELYFEDTANPGGTNPKSADNRIKYKYCIKPWDDFAAAYAKVADYNKNASAVMWTAGYNNAYTNTTVNTLAQELLNAKAKVTEHKIDESNTYLVIPASGSEFYNAKYKMATCEVDGLVAKLSNCPNCKEAIYVEDTPINHPGHTPLTEHKGWDPTCTTTGFETYYMCERAEDAANFIAAGCKTKFVDAQGSTKYDHEPGVIPATGHTWDEQLAQDPQVATCLHGSYNAIYQCTICNKNYLDNDTYTTNVANTSDYGDQGDKLDHDIQYKEEVTPTCEHEGNLEYYYCAYGCGTLFHSDNQSDVWGAGEASPILPQLAHSFTQYTYNNDQDCVTDGTETAYCDYEMEQPEEERETDTRPAAGYEATGHNWDESHSYKAPTCVDSGNIEYYHCSNCDKNYHDNEEKTTSIVTGSTELAATGEHSLVEHFAVKATCQNDGWGTYYECGVCKQCFDSTDCDNVIADTVDDISNWEGYTPKEKGEHVLIAHEAKDATCKEGDDGWKAYWQCALCDKFYSSGDQNVDNFESNLIDVTDITTWEDYTSYKDVPHQVGEDLASDPTCVEEGFDTHFECSVCGHWFKDASGQEPIEKQPKADKDPDKHTGKWIEYSAQEATCQQDGWSQTVYQCEDCGKYYTNKNGNDTTGEKAYASLDELKEAGIYTQQKEHDLSGAPHDRDAEPFIPSTCVELGYKYIVHTCSMCGEDQAEELVQLQDYADHKPTVYVAYKAPTCMATGIQAHFECEVCGKYFKATDENTAGDAMTDEEKAAVTIDSVGHKFTVKGDLVSEATCTANAVYNYSCEYECGASTPLEEADTRTGHHMTTHAQADATCLTPGVPETYYSCDICGLNYKDNGDYTTDIYSGELSTPATGHNFQLVDSGVKEATCEEVGYRAYYICSNDNCELEGGKLLSNADTKATKDDCIKSDDELIIEKNPINHTKLEAYSAKAPTCYPWEDGHEAYSYCDGCKHYYEIYDIWYRTPVDYDTAIKLPASHTLTFYAKQEATCLDEGWNDVYVCDVCNAVFKEYTPNVDEGLSEDEIESEIILAALGHTFTEYIEREATCVTKGIAGHVECDVCHIKQICDSLESADKTYEGDDSDDIDLGLDPNKHEGTIEEKAEIPATCTEDGVRKHFECSACGAKFEDKDGTTPAGDLTLAKTGHSFPEGSKHDAVLPTCRVEGTRMYYTCDNCGKNYALDDPNQVVEITNLTIDPTYEHKLAYHAARTATCQEEGYDAYWQCSLCGDTFSSDQQGEHTAAGLAEFDKNKVTVTPAYGIHMLIQIPAVEKTCVQEGYDAYWECALCTKTFDSNDKAEMEKDLDAFNKAHTITVTPATDPTKHKIVEVGGTPATCVAEGTQLHYECEWCHEWFKDDSGSEKVEKTPAVAPIDENNHIDAWITYTEREATCQQDGWKQTVYECKGCGKLYSAHDNAKTESANKLADNKDGLTEEYYEAQKPHNQAETSEQTVIASTCTTQGYKLVTYACDMCHAIQKNELVSLELADHDTNYIPEKAATCMATGNDAYFECSVCGKYFVATDETTAGAEIEDKTSVVKDRVDHDYTDGEIKATITDPTCTEYAVVEVECVYECGATINRSATAADGDDYAPIGHKFNKHEATDSTCIEAGYDTYYTCDNNCGTLFSDDKADAIIDAISYKDLDPDNHPTDSVKKAAEAVAATCTENGWMERSYCEACGKYFADGVSPKESLEDPAFVVKTEGHKFVKHEAVPSTCKTPGNDLYYSCDNCYLLFSTEDANRVIDGVPYRELDQNAHPEGKITQVETAKEATCVETGKTDIYQCSECGKYFDNEEGKGTPRDSADDDSFVIPANGHEFVFVPGVTAACEEGVDYYKAHYTCNNCELYFLVATDRFDKVGVNYDEDIKLDADPNNHTDINYVELVDANCADWTDGVRAHYYCDGCKNYYEVSDTNREHPLKEADFTFAPQHTLEDKGEKEATCLDAGYKHYWECSVCGAKFLENTPDEKTGVDYNTDIAISAKGHTFNVYVPAVEPTCVAGGNEGYVECEVCHIKQICDSLDAADKNFKGDDSNDIDLAPVPENHKLNPVEGKDATCTEAGIKAHYVCEYCNATFEDQNGQTKLDDIVIPASGHKFESEGAHHEYTPATCYDDGNIEYFTCDVCHKSFATDSETSVDEITNVAILSTGHTLVARSASTPTCVDPGWEAYWECGVCGKLFDVGVQEDGDSEAFDTAHKIADNAEGLKNWDKYYEKGDHLLIHHDAHTGDCQNMGWEEYYECAYCNLKFEDSNGDKEITDFENAWKKLGNHDIRQTGGTPATCIAEGEDIHFECAICGNWFKDSTGSKQVDKETPVTGVNENNHVNGWITHDMQEEATCKADYWKQTVYECAACGKFYSAHNDAITETANKLGDSLDDLKEKGIYAEKLAHNFTDKGCRVEKTELQKPSCTLDGIYLVKTYCSLCDEVYETGTENTGKLAHTPNHVEEQPSTCQAEGLKEHYECTVCNQLFAADDENCTGNPITRESLVIERAEHKYTGDIKVVTPATCLKNAVIEVACEYGCGAVETRSATEADNTDKVKYTATGHDTYTETENEVPGKDCQTEGTYDEVVYCHNANCDLNGEVSRVTKSDGKVGTQHIPGEAKQEEIKNATCTENGSYKLVTRCQYHSDVVLSSEDGTIDATGHIFKYVEGKTPTCEEGGYKAYYTCENADCDLYFLDASESSRFDKVGVDYVTDIELDKDPSNHTKLAHVDEVPATCDKPGMRAHYHCEGCGNYYEVSDLGTPVEKGEAAFVVDAAHTLVPVAAKTATCIDPGWGEYWKCSVCNKFFNSDDPSAEGLDSLEELNSYLEHGAHVLVHINEKTATCLADGWDEYWYCALCENYYDADMPTDGYDYDTFENHNLHINAITEWEDGYHHKEDAAHVIEDNLATPATCVAPGYGEHYACSVCGKWFSDKNGTDPIDEKPEAPIDLNNHVGEWIHNSETPATCEKTGFKLDNVQCSACGNYYADEQHTTEDDIIDPENVIAPIISHNEDETSTTHVIDSTCTTNGYDLVTYSCDMCHQIQRTELVALALAKHQTSKVEAKAPTCYSDGVKKDYLVCSVCGKYFEVGADGSIGDEITDKGSVVDPKVSHDYTGEIAGTVIKATCTENATIEVKCKYDCGATTTRLATAADGDEYTATGHKLDKHDAVEGADCQTKGTAEYWQCTVCGAMFTTDDPNTGDPIDSLEDWDGYYTEYGPHHTTKVEAKDPTCKETGMVEHLECSVCGNYFKVGENDSIGDEIEDKNSVIKETVPHDYTKGKIAGIVIDATCLTNATVEVECVYGCGAKENRLATEADDVKYQATGHTFSEYHDAVEPTCVDTGSEGYVECDVCHIKAICDSLEDAKANYAKYADDDFDKIVLDPVEENHSLVKGEEARDVTCTVDGIVENYVCEYCGKIFADQDGKTPLDTIYVTAEGHKFTKDGAHHDASPATCYDPGNIEYYTCDGCQKNFYTNGAFDNAEVEDTSVPATGHTLVGGNNGQTATCVSPGWNEYWTCSGCGKLFDIGDQGNEDIKAFDKEHYICDSFDDIADWEEGYTEKGKHTLVKHAAQEATCLQDGWKDYWECALCGKCYSTDAQGDDYDYDTFEKNKVADTKADISDWEDGYTKAETVPHTIGKALATDATCIAPGYGEHYECSVCRKWFTQEDDGSQKEIDKQPVEDIDPNNHAGGNWTVYNVQTATCQQEGWSQIVYKCNDCGAYYSDYDKDSNTTETDDKLGDSLEELTEAGIYTAIAPHNYEGGRQVTEEVIAASCTAEGLNIVLTYCVSCDEVYIHTTVSTAKLAHTPKEVERVDATCMSTGMEAYNMCTVCGNWFAEEDKDCTGDMLTEEQKADLVIPRADHDYTGDITVINNATCTEYAEIEVACRYGCGAKERRTATADDAEKYHPTGHDLNEHPVTEPTCTDKGHEAYYTCNNGCGTLFSGEDSSEIIDDIPYIDVDPNAHPEGKVTLAGPAEAATCLKDGWVDRYQCSECKMYFDNEAGTGDPKASIEDKSFVVPALGHDFEEHAEEASTCMVKGHDTYYTCKNNCGTLFSEENAYKTIDGIPYRELDPNNHAGEVTLVGPAEAATCLKDGWVDRYQCSECNKYFADENGKGDPKDSVEDDSFITPATGHDFVLVDEQAKGATCLEPGIKAHYECANDYCDLTVDGEKAKFLDNTDTAASKGDDNSEFDIPVDADAHVNLHHEAGYDPTCSPWKVGMRDHITCDCGAYYEVNDIYYENALTKADFEIDPEHTLKDMGEQSATCLVDGYKHYWECSVCGAQFLANTPDVEIGVDYETDIKLPKSGHDPAEAVIENAVDGADCQHNGSHDEVVYCRNEWCDVEGGAELSRETVTDALGQHVPGEPQRENVVDVTCTEDGSYDLVTRCTLCNEITAEVKDQVIPANGHDWDEDYTIDKEPTCTEDGSKSHHCKNCDAQTEPETVPATGHSFGEWEIVEAPDCENGGSRKHTCTECDYSETEELASIGHDWEEDYTIDQEPTCTEEGSKSHHCKNCDAQTEPETVPANGHSFGEWEIVESPDCENGGSRKHTCTECGYSETEELASIGHDWDEDYTIDKEPTCTEDGSKSHHCTNCDAQKDTETIPANGHSFGEWEIVESPDCENGGSRKHTCTECGYVETEDLDPNGHDWEEDYTIDQEPTCTEDGSKSHHCKNCDAQIDSEVIPATGHDWITDPGVEPTPTDPGLTEGKHCANCDEKVEQEVIPATGEYELEILEGEDQRYLIDSYEDKTIVCNGNYNLFIELLLEGEHVDEANYTVKEGSTIITFKSEFLNTLAPGKYKVTLVYTYDSIDATLTVIEKATEAPTEEPPTEAPTEAPTVPSTEPTTEETTKAPGNTSTTSPITGLAITIPVFSLVALAGGFFSLGYAGKKKKSEEEE